MKIKKLITTMLALALIQFCQEAEKIEKRKVGLLIVAFWPAKRPVHFVDLIAPGMPGYDFDRGNQIIFIIG